MEDLKEPIADSAKYPLNLKKSEIQTLKSKILNKEELSDIELEMLISIIDGSSFWKNKYVTLQKKLLLLYNEEGLTIRHFEYDE